MKMEEYKKKIKSEALEFHAMIGADICIGMLPLSLSCQYGGEDSALSMVWVNQDKGEMGLDALSGVFSDSPMNFLIPDAIADFHLAITKISLSYFFKRNASRFLLEALPYGSFIVETAVEERTRTLGFYLHLNGRFYFQDLPVLGDGARPSDCIGLKLFSVVTRPDRTNLEARIALTMMGADMEFPLSMEFPSNRALPRGSGGGDSVKWMDVNKDAGPLHLSRLGFEMGDGLVTAYVDAGVRLSVLLLEFMGLYLSIPLKDGEKAAFGISGLALSMTRPPLYISGGLYISGAGKEAVYTGEIAVRMKNFGASALCSYGKLNQGEDTLFAFLMLDFSLGGPPVFYVTGIAGGFGYNRGISLPAKVKDVGVFPFVAAAMGKGELKPDMSPGEVLVRMNDYIKPASNQYFVSAGVRFNSFGLVESFALLNVAFGERFELSLLGLSKLSLPPKSSSPFIYIELALKLVVAPDDGLFSAEGALSSASFLLHPDCRIQGGFAFFVWFGKNEHAGDFVITLGGYRSGFYVKHYPEVDRLGVNWKKNSGLTLAASFYFALTPACIMMGGNLGITFEWGRLKAWLRVWAEFFLRWKPFYYEISVGVTVGASYRWDFFPFYKTFSVELGADLELWGPPFGGKAHISWFVISFTIDLGEDKPDKNTIDWENFADTFLQEAGKNKLHLENHRERDLIGIQPAEGLIREATEGEAALMDSDHLCLEISTPLMCTMVKYGETQNKGDRALGILPMGVKTMQSILTAELSKRSEKFVMTPIYSDVPRALWDTSVPPNDTSDMLIEKVLSGMSITCVSNEPTGILPENGAYDMEVLCKNEQLREHTYSFVEPGAVDPGQYPEKDRLRQIETSIGLMGGERKRILDELSEVFGICREEELDVSGWTSGLDELLYAQPVLQRIGADRKSKEAGQ